jgi:hypothetical protein
MVYRLRMRTTPGGVVTLSLGYGWRVFFAVVTVVLIGVALDEGQVQGILPVLVLVSFFASIYHERWVFDPAEDAVVSRIGVFLLARTRRYRLSALRRILVRVRSTADPASELHERSPYRGRSAIITGITQRGYAQLILNFESDNPVVQTESVRNRHHVKALAEELAEGLGVPLQISPG